MLLNFRVVGKEREVMIVLLAKEERDKKFLGFVGSVTVGAGVVVEQREEDEKSSRRKSKWSLVK